ncbi:UDP-N-acetylmuramoyl-L-alanine--D-glutamate ligase [Salsuginibacillus kocurii]|uniref:UDP-N-acetylmuramoyl-L-alanine--D-glutamate ligase n=1 Tax=Salsuginibacillus kocurii TaxID=427078 RepID=UPI00036A7319|nr:UDP-N-acetylmuramoyl-L-alanine--D-glutamate ligase [Salsuginibacillus kocurii]
MKQITTFNGKEVLVLGMAKSGVAAAKLLHQLGAYVTINDALPEEKLTNVEALRNQGIKVVAGGHPLSLVNEKLAAVVKNPGIPYHNSLVQAAEEKQVPVLTELELSYLVNEGRLIAITGSNGKTTTTTLIHEMLQASSQASHLAGNIGSVACEVAQQVKKSEVMVTEVSSFQLKGTASFCPDIAVWLNIYDAHLDYHGTKEDYIQSKAKIMRNLTSDSTFVYNVEDPVIASYAKESSASLLPFSNKRLLKEGISFVNGALYVKGEFLINEGDILLPGEHNHENMIAAVAAALESGATYAGIRNVLKTFTGVTHRLQYIGEVAGREVYNDSKATNVLATEKALSAFQTPVVLIAGGLDRGHHFHSLIEHMNHVKTVISYGETKEKWAEVASSAKCKYIRAVDTLDEAVTEAFEHSASGDVLLLSPACASWDQFATFEERGKHFIELVKSLPK